MRGEFWPQGIAGRRDDADAAPVGIDHVHRGAELTLRGRVAAGPYHLGIAIIEKALILHKLPQHRVESGHQGLGGKSPDIVFADADLEIAVPGAGMAVFANSGQICSAGTRLFVERRIYDEFVGRVAEFGGGLRVGNGLEPETQIGPLVSEQQLERVTGYLSIGKREGARAVSGGERLTQGPFAKGYFVPPTVFADVRDDMRIAQDEIFGPVLSAIAFQDIDEVISRANATPFGLGSGVWTRDVSKAHRLAKAIRAGSVWVNCYQAMDPAVPFGGYKMSGYGRESGLQHLEEYLNVKAVWIRTA